MSTQYDKIGETYDEMKKFPIPRLECVNLESALAPYISNAKVLDLACGTGYYSRLFIEWGAKSVVGVDISMVMISTAESDLTNAERLRFHIGDCSIPQVYDGGPFDVVVGAWLLNYASDAVEMRNMFQNITLNLKEGGHFIGVTPHPTSDPVGFMETSRAAKPTQCGATTVNVIGDVEEGVKTRLDTKTEAGMVGFENYHLEKEVYKKAARDGGMRGEFSWKPISIPDDYPEFQRKARDAYLKVPHFGVLVIAKS